MVTYNLVAEYCSLLIVTIIIISFFSDNELDSVRNKWFRSMFYSAFISISTNILSTTISANFSSFPLWVVDLMNTLYYILLPFPLVMVFIYSLTLIKPKDSAKAIENVGFYLVPYLIYSLFVLINLELRFIYEISPETGYVRGPAYQSPYIIAAIYVFSILLLSYIKGNEIKKGIRIIFTLNVLICCVIMYVQFMNPHIHLAGLANAACMLVSYLYIHNVNEATDKLTGLLNRASLTYKLSKLSEHSAEFSLVIYSMRGFKSVNEKFGLEYGNGLLEIIGKYLNNTFEKHNVYRYSGDEFAVLITRNSYITDKLIEQVADRFAEPFDNDNFSTKLDVVYTRVDYPSFGKDSKTLVSAADYALATLKKSVGESNYLYDISICDKMHRKHTVLERIKSEIDNDGFEVYLQPIYSSDEHKFSQAEALVRLSSTNSHEAIFPNEFIPLAEETSLITNITYIVLEKTCRHFRNLIDKYGDDLQLKSISVNFPYIQFFQTNIVDRLCEITKKYDIDPSMIKIEITERTLISSDNTLHNIMAEMQDKGFVFELDDFGVEYSNLSVFLSLPVTIIKVDKSLVRAANSSPERRMFFENLIRGIKAMRKQTIVEGIETSDQLDFFKECGCEYIQGYYFSKPLPIDEFTEFIKHEPR